MAKPPPKPASGPSFEDIVKRDKIAIILVVIGAFAMAVMLLAPTIRHKEEQVTVPLAASYCSEIIKICTGTGKAR